MKNNILLLVVFIFLVGSGWLAYQRLVVKTPTPTAKTTLKVAGSGSAGFALKNWTDYYQKKNPNIQFEFLPSADAAVGIRGVKEKTLDIGVASRKAKPGEEFPEMVSTLFTKDAVAFAINKSMMGVKNLTGQQLADIYTGKITNWQEVGGEKTEIIVVDREEAESAKKLFRELYLKDKKVATDVVEVHSEADVLSAVVTTPNSIGYLSYGRAKTADIVVLSVNSIEVEEGMREATYPLTRDYYIFTRTDNPKAVADFVVFLKEEGKSLAEKFFYFKP